MTQYYSGASGNFSSTGTWLAGVVPAAPHVVYIQSGHTVTVDANTTIGHSPAAGDTTAAIYIEDGGKLIIAGGVTLTCRGDIDIRASNATVGLQLNAGGKLYMDASQAATPSTARYRIIQKGQWPGSQPSIQIDGTSDSRCEVRSVNTNSAANARFVGNGANYYGLIKAAYTDFLRIGDASNPFAEVALNSDDSADPQSTLDLQQCHFDYCGTLDGTSYAQVGPRAKFYLYRCKWTNTLGDRCIDFSFYSTKTGSNTVRQISRCAFDKKIRINSPRNLEVTMCYLGEGFETSETDASGWATFQGNFVRLTSTVNDVTLNGVTDRCYFLYDDNAGTNPHFVTLGRYSTATNTIQDCIFDFTGSNAEGDCISIYAAGSPSRTCTIKNNLILPNASGECSGTLLSALGSAYTPLVVEHNTYHTGSQGAAVGETYAGYAGMLSSFKSNLAWDSSSGRGYKLYDSGSNDSVSDLVSSANCDYNGGYNLLAGSNLKGYNNLEFSSGSPGAHDVSANPTFVDSARDAAAFGAAVLSTDGTLAAALTRIHNDPTWYYYPNEANCVWAWVRAGFAPTNAAFKDAGHDAATIGAVEGLWGAALNVAASASASGSATAALVRRQYLKTGTLPEPLAGVAQYWSYLAEWAGYLQDWYAAHPAGPSNTDMRQRNCYYDGLFAQWKLKDHLGGAATYDALRAAQYDTYLDYVNTALPVGGVNGYTNFTDGLLQEVLRGTANAATAKTAISNILVNGAYVAYSGDPQSSWMYARETAYALACHVNAVRAGIALDGTQTARMATLKGFALGHIDQWTGGTASYMKVFMAGLCAKGLIWHYTYVAPDATVLTKLQTLASYVWNSCWQPQNNTFQHSDRPHNDPNDDAVWNAPQPDLAMLIFPLYAWLWYQTGNGDWLAKARQIFAGALPTYSGTTWVSGAYLGTRSATNPAGKQYDQQVFWGPEGIAWAESVPLAGTAPSADTSATAALSFYQPPEVFNPTLSRFNYIYRVDVELARYDESGRVVETVMYSLTNKPLADDPEHVFQFWPLLQSVGEISYAAGEYLPTVSVGSIEIVDASGTFAHDRKFSDLLERYSPVGRPVVVAVLRAQTYTSDLFYQWEERARATVESWSRDCREGVLTLNLTAERIKDEALSLQIDPAVSGLEDAPSSAVGRPLPLLVGRRAESPAVVPVRISPDGDPNPQWAYATGLYGHLDGSCPWDSSVLKTKNYNGEWEPLGGAGTDYMDGPGMTSGVSDVYALDAADAQAFDWYQPAMYEVVASGVRLLAKNQGAADRVSPATLRVFVLRYDLDTYEVLGEAAVGKVALLHYDAQNNNTTPNTPFGISVSFDKPLYLASGASSARAVLYGFERALWGYALGWSVTNFASGDLALYHRDNGYCNQFRKGKGAGENTADWRLVSGPNRPLRFCFITPTVSWSGGSLGRTARGLSYSQVAFTLPATGPGQTHPDYDAFPLVVSRTGGLTRTGTDEQEIRPDRLLHRLSYQWNGSIWADPGAWDTSRFADRYEALYSDSGAGGTRYLTGTLEGRVTFPQLVEQVCRDTASRVGVLSSTGKLFLWPWGAAQGTAMKIRPADLIPVEWRQEGEGSVVSRAVIQYARSADVNLRDEEMRPFDVDSSPEYTGFLDYSEAFSPAARAVTAPGLALYGDRTPAEVAAPLIATARSAQTLAEHLTASNRAPRVYATFLVPYENHAAIEMFDVVEFGHPDFPAFHGTDPAPPLPVLDGSALPSPDATKTQALDPWQGHEAVRCQCYRGLVEAKTFLLPRDHAPQIRLTVRVLLNHPVDPT